jgi:hypothetical protein
VYYLVKTYEKFLALLVKYCHILTAAIFVYQKAFNPNIFFYHRTVQGDLTPLVQEKYRNEKASQQTDFTGKLFHAKY